MCLKLLAGISPLQVEEPPGFYGMVCGTVSSIMSGLETRSLGLNTLGTR